MCVIVSVGECGCGCKCGRGCDCGCDCGCGYECGCEYDNSYADDLLHVAC